MHGCVCGMDVVIGCLDNHHLIMNQSLFTPEQVNFVAKVGAHIIFLPPVHLDMIVGRVPL